MNAFRRQARRVLTTTARHYGLPPRRMVCLGCGAQTAESDVLARHCTTCATRLMAGDATPSGERLLARGPVVCASRKEAED